MATVKAPKTGTMDAINLKSIVSYVLNGTDVTFYNREGVAVGTMTVNIDTNLLTPMIRRIGSDDFGYRDVLIKNWYHPRIPNVKVADPAPMSTGTLRETSWSPDGLFVAIAQDAGDGKALSIYSKFNDTFTRVYNEGLGSSPGYSVAWSPNGKYVIYSVQSSTFQPKLSFVKNTSGSFAKLTSGVPDGADFAGGSADAPKIRWNPNGNYVAIFWDYGDTRIYKRTGDTFTLIANSLPTNALTDFIWSPDGKYLAILSTQSPTVSIYKQTGDTFTRLTANGISADDIYGRAAWSPDGRYLVGGTGASPALALFEKSGDNFVRKTVTASHSVVSSTTSGIAFSADGRYVITAFGTLYGLYSLENGVLTPMSSIYYSLPGFIQDIQMSPDGKYLSIAHVASPYFTIHKSAMAPRQGLPTRYA